eukprot:tig00020816_g14095.t1
MAVPSVDFVTPSFVDPLQALVSLEDDHRLLRRCFAMLDTSADDNERYQIVVEALREVAIHGFTERKARLAAARALSRRLRAGLALRTRSPHVAQVLYPLLLTTGGAELCREGLRRHDALEEAAGRIESMTLKDPELGQAMHALRTAFEEHTRFEDEHVYPALRGPVMSQGSDFGSGLLSAVVAAKRTAPTSPSTLCLLARGDWTLAKSGVPLPGSEPENRPAQGRAEEAGPGAMEAAPTASPGPLAAAAGAPAAAAAGRGPARRDARVLWPAPVLHPGGWERVGSPASSGLPSPFARPGSALGPDPSRPESYGEMMHRTQEDRPAPEPE